MKPGSDYNSWEDFFLKIATEFNEATKEKCKKIVNNSDINKQLDPETVRYTARNALRVQRSDQLGRDIDQPCIGHIELNYTKS